MKRLILAVAGTIAGLIALLSFRTQAGPAAAGSLPAATLGPAPSLVTPSARTLVARTSMMTVSVNWRDDTGLPRR